MLTFGNHRLREMTTIFSPNAANHQNAADGCPDAEHQHMVLVFVSLDGSEADQVLAFDQNPETEEWSINQEVTMYMMAQAEAAFMAQKLSNLFGTEINVEPVMGMSTMNPQQDPNDDRPYPGMYL